MACSTYPNLTYSNLTADDRPNASASAALTHLPGLP